jgi:hypothetical protein
LYTAERRSASLRRDVDLALARRVRGVAGVEAHQGDALVDERHLEAALAALAELSRVKRFEQLRGGRAATSFGDHRDEAAALSGDGGGFSRGGAVRSVAALKVARYLLERPSPRCYLDALPA